MPHPLAAQQPPARHPAPSPKLHDLYSYQRCLARNLARLPAKPASRPLPAHSIDSSTPITTRTSSHFHPQTRVSDSRHYKHAEYSIRKTNPENTKMNTTATGFSPYRHLPKFNTTTTNIKSVANSTSFTFRPSTNNHSRRSNQNEGEDHKRYLSRYEIVRELGKGTFGVVYLARRIGAEGAGVTGSVHMGTEGEGSISGVYASREGLGQSDRQVGEVEGSQGGVRESQLLTSIQHPQNELVESKQMQKQQEQGQIKQPDGQTNNLAPEQPQPDTHVAIKVYQKFKMNKDPTKFKNIRKQITIMQNIQHPHIIRLHQSVQTLTKISLVVEYGGSQSLLDYLKQHHPLAEPVLRRIGNQLLSALVYLHGRNIVHRDLKLQNILVMPGAGVQVKIIDFGFSTLTYKDRKLNAICGTPNYMAPEVLARREYIGEFADVWSYGVVMYTLAEGRHPFKADTYKQLERVTNRGVFEFRRVTNVVHQAFIRKILRVKPGDRPRAADLAGHPWLAINDGHDEQA